MKNTLCALGFSLSFGLLLGATSPVPRGADPLEAAWSNPPPSARLRAYWWWLNSNVTKEALTRDLEQMKAKGFGGALIFDAGGAEQRGNAQVPRGPTFFSPAWRELYRHALREADRLGLEMSLNIQSGWNLGGPMVTPDDAPKKLTWSELRVTGPARVATPLAAPKARDNFYRDLFVLAYRVRPDLPVKRAPLQNQLEVNGKSCGIVWAPPFRVDVTDAVKPTGNTLEIEVVNFWPNRVIGDAALPEAQRLTKTNILELTAKTPLTESGLLGPVTLGTMAPRE